MKSRYIIFADDDADDLELITGFFKHYNNSTEVRECRDGKEVMQLLDGLNHDEPTPLLVVIDINMPRMNGKETLMAMRHNPRYKNIPVVIYTTTINESDENYYSQLGASCFSKPASMEGVRQTARILADFCASQI